MDWYAVEPLATIDPRRAARLAASLADPADPRVHGSAGRRDRHARVAGDPRQGTRSCRPARRCALPLSCRDRGGPCEGRRQVAMPAEWPSVFRPAGGRRGTSVRSRSMSLALAVRRSEGAGGTAGDPDRSRQAGVASRQEALAALLKAKDATLPAQLHGLVLDPGTGWSRRCAGSRLMTIPRRPASFLQSYARLGRFEHRDALNTLGSRPRVGPGHARGRRGGQCVPRRPDGGPRPAAPQPPRQGRRRADQKVWGSVRETTGRPRPEHRPVQGHADGEGGPPARPAAGPRRLRQDMPAVPHLVRRRGQGRSRSHRLQPCRPRLCAVERPRPQCLDRSRLPRAHDGDRGMAGC